MTVTCTYCGNWAEWVSNEVVYGRPVGDSWMIWLCRPCEAWVGCHNNSKVPKGTLADRTLRELRVQCHQHIDPLWRSGRFRRSTVYRALAHVFGREIHIGEADVATCRAILALKWNTATAGTQAGRLHEPKGENTLAREMERGRPRPHLEVVPANNTNGERNGKS